MSRIAYFCSVCRAAVTHPAQVGAGHLCDQCRTGNLLYRALTAYRLAHAFNCKPRGGSGSAAHGAIA